MNETTCTFCLGFPSSLQQNMGSQAHFPHLVIAGVEPWGHARPLCAFAARVALTRDVHITLFTVPRVLERVKTEVARGFGPEHAERQKLVRVIALDTNVEGSGSFGENLKKEQERYFVVFVAAYQKLLEEKPLTCFVTNAEFPAVPAPKTVVLDFMVGSLAGTVKSMNKNAQVIGFCSGMASYLYLSFAPRERGGRGDFKQKAHSISQETGRHIHEVAEELAHTFTDEICQIPGFPKMYHWEFDPQDTKFLTNGFLGPLWLSLFETYEQCDGLLITSPEAYEPAAIAATKDWFAESKRGVWAIGPLLPSTTSEKAKSGEESLSESSAAIKTFMDETLKKNGEHSMLYISFGSAFWPQDFAKVEAFVDVLIEKKVPFIFSHGSPAAQLTDAFKEKVGKSGVGLLSPWSPQQTILVHPALGWFVTHGGHNSTLEAVSSGVPMICWPFHADQPANAVNLTENHQVAYELLEVRINNGLKPIYRTGKAPLNTIDALKAEVREVLDKAFGEDGQKKRTNVKKLKAQIDAAWDKGGPADVDMGNFLATL
ncbi:UDP-Glycosyltransferase/glycogen phosphorylase [Cristinia sonorae]|uniref:UDP-Glycosyltransferase/glycogen phosphorylase n=1 Tax=Cristinia sonorae TaxID=1940300 RepID=A0A8K0UGM0_9AGAR|nr:UDP-Glycosyltransferase/glycogen phosphorylase [Cristinia sonorae]